MPGDAVLLQLTVVVKQFRGYVVLPEVYENQFVPEHAVVLPTGGVRDPSDSEPCAWAGVGSRAKAITASAEASNSLVAIVVVGPRLIERSELSL